MKTIAAALQAALVAAAVATTQAASWSVQTTNAGTGAFGLSIVFPSVNEGFMPMNHTDSGLTIARTRDAGKTWTPAANSSIFADVDQLFGSATNGDTVVFLSAQALYVTNNHGDDWFESPVGPKNSSTSLGIFAAGDALVAVGEIVKPNSKPFLHKAVWVSNDQGHTWALNDITNAFHAIPFDGAAAGNNWFVAGGTLGDASSVEVPEGGRRISSRVIAHPEGMKYAPAPRLGATTTTSSTTGLGGLSAEIAVSTDAGKTWSSSFSSKGEFYFSKITCGTPERCCALGQASTGPRIWCTQDAGSSWSQSLFASNPAYTLSDIQFMSETQAMAVGGIMRGADPVGALMFLSNDGGKTWAQAPVNIGFRGLWATTFPAANVGHGLGVSATQTISELIWQ